MRLVAILACLGLGVGCTSGPQACLSGSDCKTGCCAPAVDSNGNRVGPYECQDTDKCCTDPLFHPCPGTSCCVTDPHDNRFCSTPCTSSSGCAGGAVCNAYSFANTSCSGSMACGPDL
jgi:hypothetical protein